MTQWLDSGLSFEKTWVQRHLLLFQSLDYFFRHTLPVSFGRDTKSCWSFYLVSMLGEVKDPTKEVNVCPFVHSRTHTAPIVGGRSISFCQN